MSDEAVTASIKSFGTIPMKEKKWIRKLVDNLQVSLKSESRCIVNYMITFKTNLEIDFLLIIPQLNNIEQEFRHHKVSITIREQNAKVILFENGNGICIGCNNEEYSVESIKITLKLLKKVQKINNKINNFKLLWYKVCNIVMRLNLPFPINLELMNSSNLHTNDLNSYNSEIFPAYLQRFPKSASDSATMQMSSMIAKIFASGKIVFCGFKSVEELSETQDGKHTRLETIIQHCFEQRINAQEVKKMIDTFSFDINNKDASDLGEWIDNEFDDDDLMNSNSLNLINPNSFIEFLNKQ